MKSFLITFKPSSESPERGWPLQDLQKLAGRHLRHGKVEDSWRFHNRKEVSVGDRVFLLLQGKAGPAIIGYGSVARASAKDKAARSVVVRFDALTDPTKQVLVTKEALRLIDGAQSLWRTQASGVRIPDDTAAALEKLVAETSAKAGKGVSSGNLIDGKTPESNKLLKSAPTYVQRQTKRVLFARVGWMRGYRGPQPDDEKPIGGGKYNKAGLGHEAFNFKPIDGKVMGYFQPQMQPKTRRKSHPSKIVLEKIEPRFAGDLLDKVLVVFVARNPVEGGQYLVGWYKNAVVHRLEKHSSASQRNRFGYFIETNSADAVLVPVGRRTFEVPRGKGGFGQANICYPFTNRAGQPKQGNWMDEALAYISSYQHEDAVQHPTSETDPDISEMIEATIERAAGYQSNPRIRKAIENYSMQWAYRRLKELGLSPVPKYKTNPYDFLCTASGADLYVEVKGTQQDGRCISLTPNEVAHVKEHKNSALFIVYGLTVKGKRSPRVSGGEELFLPKWDISSGQLEPRGFAFTLPESAFESKEVAKQN
jgi:hypothetical protein